MIIEYGLDRTARCEITETSILWKIFSSREIIRGMYVGLRAVIRCHEWEESLFFHGWNVSYCGKV